MGRIPGDWRNWDDPTFEEAHNVVAGQVAGPTGWVGDIVDMLGGAVIDDIAAPFRWDSYQQAPGQPMYEREPWQSGLPTTNEIGEALGADPSSLAFQGSTVASLDPFSKFAALAGMIPAVTKGAKRGKQALEKIWDGVDNYDDALDLAKKGGHLRRDKTGQYIGAPRGVDTPQKLAALRRSADEKVQAGSYGMGWYGEARDTAERFAPNDPAMQSLFARGGAAYSPQASPPSEIGAFAKQHNARMLTGEDVRPRTESQMHNVARAYGDDGTISPESIKLGRKTGPYGDAKDPTIPADELYKTANDIWHGRVMGYGEDFDRGFTPQEHAFLTGENLLLADRAQASDALAGIQRPTDWDPRSAQAATWAAQREQDYIAKRLAEIDKKNAERGPRTAEIIPDMDQIRAEAQAYASAGIREATERNIGYQTREARTGAGVEHLWMDDPDEIQNYTDLVSDVVYQRDPIAGPMGMYTADARPTQGQYVNSLGEMENNPGWVNEVLLSTDLDGPPTTMPWDREAMDLSALLGGVLQGQEAGAWSRFFPENMGKQRVGDMNAVLAEPGASVGGFGAVNYPEGTLIARFGDEGPVPGTTKEILAGLPEGSRPVRGTVESGYEDTMLSLYDEGQRIREPGSGAATENLLNRFEQAEDVIPGVSARTADEVSRQAKAINEIDRTIAASSGKAVREDLLKMRDILAQGGIPALRAYVEKFGSSGLPVAVLSLMGLGAVSQAPSLEGGGA